MAKLIGYLLTIEGGVGGLFVLGWTVSDLNARDLVGLLLWMLVACLLVNGIALLWWADRQNQA